MDPPIMPVSGLPAWKLCCALLTLAIAVEQAIPIFAVEQRKSHQHIYDIDQLNIEGRGQQTHPTGEVSELVHGVEAL